MAGKRKRFEEAERQRKEQGNGEDAATVLTVLLREMRQKAEELMQQSEMAGAASVLAGLSAQARVVVGEWGADEMIIDDHPFIVLTETKFSFRCIPVWIGTLLTGLGSKKKTHVIMFSP